MNLLIAQYEVGIGSFARAVRCLLPLSTKFSNSLANNTTADNDNMLSNLVINFLVVPILCHTKIICNITLPLYSGVQADGLINCFYITDFRTLFFVCFNHSLPSSLTYKADGDISRTFIAVSFLSSLLH